MLKFRVKLQYLVSVVERHPMNTHHVDYSKFTNFHFLFFYFYVFCSRDLYINSFVRCCFESTKMDIFLWSFSQTNSNLSWNFKCKISILSPQYRYFQLENSFINIFNIIKYRDEDS